VDEAIGKMTPLLAHMETVEAAVESLDPKKAYAFGAACAERQWPVYVKASEGKPWEMQSDLRMALDDIWSWLLGSGNRPQGNWQRCENAVLDAVNDVENAARTVAGSFYGLAYGVENDKLRECAQVAVNGLDLIDSFVYDILNLPVTSENDLLVDQHELIRNEMRRQEDDLKLVVSKPMSPAVIRELRARSLGRSILQDYWYK
jgi:hypothetical protein